eukprot:TRINITY_DN6069_c0_g1_i1.p1 TRINITY_DN6069_c0_g1~~TRINITY_DN6069_c0_g1_i1.p1  ORF type:complete len:369 (-),score=131.71 TRINITY_DN6069_c0_g1_i1:224-1330(-)
MFGFGRSNKQSRQNELRATQIRNFMTKNPCARAVNAQQSVFDIGLRLTTGQILTLRMSLPPTFPSTAPIFQITSPCRHTWLDASMRVIGCHALNGWGSSSDLGNVGLEIVNHFARNPPQLMGMQQAQQPQVMPRPGMMARPGMMGMQQPQQSMRQQPGMMGMQQPQMARPGMPQLQQQQQQQPMQQPRPMQQSVQPQNIQQQSQQQMPSGISMPQLNVPGQQQQTPKKEKIHTPIPPIPSKFEELEKYSIEELRSILENSDQMDDLMENLSIVRGFKELRTSTLKSNSETAQKTMSKQEELERTHAEVVALEASVKEQKAKLDGHIAKQQALMGVSVSIKYKCCNHQIWIRIFEAEPSQNTSLKLLSQ